jgi:hypothetical protein
MRVLTKSRFKLGLECPNKLFYTRKEEYPNSKSTDPFLKALAQGGFQVEELARMHYPDGILIEGNDWDYKLLWEQTKELLSKENVVIFEAAFLIDGLFVRTDILVKQGNKIELIEVKSKSFDPSDEFLLVGKKGGIVAAWKPYLFDIAFQKFVLQASFPDWKIRSYLLMADKSKQASIDGLNQLFRISKKEEGRTGIIKRVTSLEETGDSVLGRKEVTEIVNDIEANKFMYHDNLTFQDAIKLFKEKYEKDEYFGWHTSYGACKECEFTCSIEELNQGKKSGFRECFIKQHKWGDSDFEKPNNFDIYDFRRGGKLFDLGIIFKNELNEDLIGLKMVAEKLSTSHRQWLQIEKEINNDFSIYVDKEGLKQEIDSWTFPLHFIDFETSTVALPFYKGMTPYEQVAFQYSHHIYYADGSIEHATEYINNQAGVFPNFEFIRSLKNSLEIDRGTIFRYSHHENTILNAIYFQLLNSNEADKDELMAFIQDISHSKSESVVKWIGSRDMVDLCEVEKNFYFNPLTKGSNSIKAVLPATLASSQILKEKYSQPIGKINVSSKNFQESHIWLQNEGGKVTNPYKMLPPLFENWTVEQLETTLSEMEGLSDGGAALTAYGKLQYTDMEQAEIEELTTALLKYCELDTLAMVMIYEHFRELAYGDF